MAESAITVELWRVGVATLPLVALLVGLLVLGWSGTKSGKVVLGTATTGLPGKEGLVMRMTLPYAVILTAGLGLLGFLLILLGR